MDCRAQDGRVHPAQTSTVLGRVSRLFYRPDLMTFCFEDCRAVRARRPAARPPTPRASSTALLELGIVPNDATGRRLISDDAHYRFVDGPGVGRSFAADGMDQRPHFVSAQ